MENWTTNEPQNSWENSMNEERPRRRHGCVTAWLIFGIAANTIGGLGYILLRDMLPEAMKQFSEVKMELTPNYFLMEGIISLSLVFCFVQLWQWKKLGFHGIILCTMVAATVNYLTYHQWTDFIFSFTGVLIHYLVLQIKIDEQTAWSHLK